MEFQNREGVAAIPEMGSVTLGTGRLDQEPHFAVDVTDGSGRARQPATAKALRTRRLVSAEAGHRGPAQESRERPLYRLAALPLEREAAFCLYISASAR